MLTLVSSNDCPTIGSLRLRRNATNEIEADEIFSENSESRIIAVDINKMPFTELVTEIPKDEQPILKRFRAGDAFRLAVYNFTANDSVPLVGFSIERVRDSNDIFLTGSKQIIDPSKSGLTKSAIAVIPLLHIFNKEIDREAKRAAKLIEKSSGNPNVASLAGELDKRMMREALTATHNVMQALYGDKMPEKPAEAPETGIDCITKKLHQTLDASGSFYDALMAKTRDIFEPSIRTLGEKMALGRFQYN